MRIRTPRVFLYRNYRLYFAGQIVSLMGTQAQAIAMGWLVYRLTDSLFLLGLVAFLSLGPHFFISPFGGAIADRLDRRRIFIVTQTISMGLAAILTVLTLLGVIDVTMVIVLALAQGVTTALETPARQAFTIEMVGRDDLRQAIAYNAMMFNLGRTVGPALGGIIVAIVGEGVCFLLNTFSYGAVLAALLLMRMERRQLNLTSRPWDDLKQGLAYVTRHTEIRAALLLSMSTAFFGTSFLALLPAYARDVLNQDSNALGFVMGSFGCGAFLGAALASRVPERYNVLTPILGAGALGIALIFFANMTNLFGAIAFVLPGGVGYLLVAVCNNTRVQMLSDDSMRGRVMAFYAMSALGCQPLGALALGYIATYIGVPKALTLSGIAVVVATILSFIAWKRRNQAASAGTAVP